MEPFKADPGRGRKGEDGMGRSISAINTGLRELYPIFCGCEDCEGGHAFGPNVRDFYLIHCVRAGRGLFARGGREYALRSGQCFVIRPGEITTYRADEREPWSYTWIAFGGENAPLFAERAGLLEADVLENPGVAAVFARLYGQIGDGTLETENNEYAMLSALYAIFAALPLRRPKTSVCGLYVERVRNYVANMLSNPIPVAKLAADCGLERHYLCRVFRERTGQTLQAYILGRKMDRARSLLLMTGLRVGDIARSVGYTDVYNFSKMFKKAFGLSPMKLRAAQAKKPE